MVSRRWFAAVLAVTCVVTSLVAQPAKPRNPVEERLKAGRLEVPEGVDNGKFNQMRNGNVALSTPTDAEKAVLEGRAKQLIYPVTHFEYYSSPESPTAELTPRTDEKTVAKLLSDLRSQLLVIAPGDASVPAPKLDFARAFGEAAVKAVDDVLAKGPQPVVRMNAMRMLAVVAETGAPAATERVIKLLADKEKLPVDVLYYALKTAENAISAYDPGRSADAQKWVNRDKYYALVTAVDDIVNKVPATVALQTYLPDQLGSGTLTTDPKNPPKAPSQLTSEQEATVQAFRLQAVRALAKVKTEVVYDSKNENKRRTAYTLAKIAVSDTTLVPAPSAREVIEAVGGLATAVPNDPELDPLVLVVAMARGVGEYADKKIPGQAETGPVAQQWKLTGARMKATFQLWETAVSKSRLDKASKDLLKEFSQQAIALVFDPLSKQTETGVVNGLNVGALTEWRTKKEADLKKWQLFKDTDTGMNSGTTKLSPK
jgi:hypothetical protein